MLRLQASVDAALSRKPGRPVTRGGHASIPYFMFAFQEAVPLQY